MNRETFYREIIEQHREIIESLKASAGYSSGTSPSSAYSARLEVERVVKALGEERRLTREALDRHCVPCDANHHYYPL